MMKRRGRIQVIAAFAATLPFILPPQLVLADKPHGEGHRIGALDVELSPDGVLAGQILDPAGQPVENVPLRLIHRGQTVSVTASDQTGGFRFAGIRGGTHQITTPNGAVPVRCWKSRTAPPAAHNAILLVSDGKTVRAQHPISHLFTNPLVVGLAIAMAIAIPIIVNNSDSGAGSP
jgi:hypothetical protein